MIVLFDDRMSRRSSPVQTVRSEPGTPDSELRLMEEQFLRGKECQNIDQLRPEYAPEWLRNARYARERNLFNDLFDHRVFRIVAKSYPVTMASVQCATDFGGGISVALVSKLLSFL